MIHIRYGAPISYNPPPIVHFGSFSDAFKALKPSSNTGTLGRKKKKEKGDLDSYRCTTPDIDLQVNKQFKRHNKYPDCSECFESLVYQYHTGDKSDLSKAKVRNELPLNCKKLDHFKGRVLYRGTSMNDVSTRFFTGYKYNSVTKYLTEVNSSKFDSFTKKSIGKTIMLTDSIARNSTKNFGITSASTRTDVAVSYATNTSEQYKEKPIMIVLKIDSKSLPKGYIPRYNGKVFVNGKDTFKDEILLDPTNTFTFVKFKSYSRKHGMAKVEIKLSHD